MIKAKQIVVLLITLVLLTSNVCLAQEESLESVIYGPTFQPINRFVIIAVDVQADVSLKISEEELTSYARLRFRNNFSDIPFITPDMFDFSEEEGYLRIEVWTVGSTYPIAYHIQIIAGNMINLRAYNDAILGYCDSKIIHEKIRNGINTLIEDFAIVFYRARNEI